MTSNILIDVLDQPEQLEQIYHRSADDFARLLSEALQLRPESETLKVWAARIAYTQPVPSPQSKGSLYLVIVLALVAGLFATLPQYFSISSNWYYPRFIPLCIIAPVILYFLQKKTFSFIQKILVFALVLSVGYMFVLPDRPDSASIIMSQIHAPLVLLMLLGISFMAEQWRETSARLFYIRYLGEAAIFTVLILLGGVVLTAVTIGLFNLIGMNVEKWYTENVVVFGVVAAPLVATYIYDRVLHQQSRLASILSNIFSPLFFITILAYLIATVYQGKSPYSDRDFLIIFNGLLIIIWAISVFSVADRGKAIGSKVIDIINIALVAVTLLVNGVALSAIIFRWAEFGITPNRVVVTGANVLIFVNLLLLLWQYLKYIRAQVSVEALERTIAEYLPVYSVWSIFVVVVLPILFGFS